MIRECIFCGSVLVFCQMTPRLEFLVPSQSDQTPLALSLSLFFYLLYSRHPFLLWGIGLLLVPLSPFLSLSLPTVASHRVRVQAVDSHTYRNPQSIRPLVSHQHNVLAFLRKWKQVLSCKSCRLALSVCICGLESSEASALRSQLHDMIDTLSWFLSHVMYRSLI